MAADYTRGEMNIASQKSTFDGFIVGTVWISLLMIVTLLYLTLVFAVGMDWMGSLIGVAIVGVVLGLVTSMKTSWYVTVGGLFVFGLLCGLLSQLFSVFLAG
ncbi:aa3-type cytochrome c oxidase subunit IV [Maricaulis sp.]|uniref:aa3-type cytochrome c oxidase subunit IV n=1 Tax=Maricaulis sp. TaxID=1486257 RepID=UPI003A8E9AD7